jgi:hypothetical protein
MPKRNEYSKENLEKALQEIQSKRTSIRAAGIKYQIPRGTLQFKLKNPLSKSNCGPDPILSHEEEKDLEKWLMDMSRKGFPRKKEEILDSVQKFLTVNPRTNPFTENRPGRGWLRSFLKRHPTIAERSSEGVTRASACVTEADIRKWFSEIKAYLTEKGLLNVMNDPSRVYNADETGFLTCPATGRVLAPKGDKNVYSVEQGNTKESITVLYTFSAEGKVCPPVIVFPYKRLPERLAASVPPAWGIGRSDSGWMTADVFSEFITGVFSPYLTAQNIQRPVCLFIDGHKSHITLNVSTLCRENGIELIALYPNTTRITQPADVAVFGPIKKMWRKEVRNFQIKKVGEVVTKQVFASLLKNVVDSVNPDNLRQGFRACGLYPFDENAIDYSKCLGQSTNKDEEISIHRKMTYKDFCGIVGQEKVSQICTFKRGSGTTNADGILYDLHNFFKENVTESQNNETKNEADANMIYSTEFATTSFHISNESNTTKINITLTPIKASESSEPLTSSESTSNKTKIEDVKRKSDSIRSFLQQPPENKRKCLRNTEKNPFVITSEKFRDIMEKKKLDKEQKEKEIIMKKKKREELAVARKIKQETKSNKGSNKKANTPNLEHFEKSNKIQTKIPLIEFQNIPIIVPSPSTSEVKKNIHIISNEPVTFCFVCKRICLKQKELLCSSCNKMCHQSCVPKNHEENLPEEDEMSEFICHKCYILEDDTDFSDDTMTVDDMFKMFDEKA